MHWARARCAALGLPAAGAAAAGSAAAALAMPHSSLSLLRTPGACAPRTQVDQIYHLACPASPVHYK